MMGRRKKAIPATELETRAEPEELLLTSAAAKDVEYVPHTEPPEVHCNYSVIHGDTWADLETQVNIECNERGAIPTGGPVVAFGLGTSTPYSQAVIYPVER